jgi:hypothetical protein
LVAAVELGGCSKLDGLDPTVPTVVTFELEASGSVPMRADGTTPELQIALVWGAQWLPEPFCILPATSTDAATVITAGCRDPFGFVPQRVEANVPITLGAPVTLPLVNVPAADVLVGEVDSRVAYGSFVLYDDVNGNGTLDLGRPNHTASGGSNMGPMSPTQTSTRDIVYGASFTSMTSPDARVAFSEGAFDAAAAFYPRAGCPAPVDGFSILGAGGFSAAAGLAAALAGDLPQEDPSTCTQGVPEATPVVIAAGAASADEETACVERVDDSSARYREPPADSPDFTERVYACTGLPDLGSDANSDVVQLVVSGRTDDSCVGLTHYVLTGCSTDPLCAAPTWDLSASPPSWWPCSAQAAR